MSEIQQEIKHSTTYEVLKNRILNGKYFNSEMMVQVIRRRTDEMAISVEEETELVALAKEYGGGKSLLERVEELERINIEQDIALMELGDLVGTMM